jgi:hypothetical protein
MALTANANSVRFVSQAGMAAQPVHLRHAVDQPTPQSVNGNFPIPGIARETSQLAPNSAYKIQHPHRAGRHTGRGLARRSIYRNKN